MPDAQKVYAEDGDDRRRENLRLVWPDLHAALEAARSHDVGVRRTICALGHPQPYPEAVGRMTLNGTPACSEHSPKYPLELVDPGKWKP
jgi:hypothetical protein